MAANIAPDAADIFGDGPAIRPTSRPSLAALAQRAGVYRLTSASPAEDVRDSLDTLRAEAVAAQLDPIERATLIKLALDALSEVGIRNARPIVRAALDAPTATRVSRANVAAITLSDDEAAPESVLGATLLDETAALMRRYVVMTPADARACALWIAAAYAIDALQLMPLLLVTAPTMRAGKTTLLTLLGAVVPRALAASNLTGAVLARAIATHKPTLLADEADTWLTDEASELRGIMNAGHTRSNAYILRCAPETHEPQLIPCFGARVLSMIRRPPSTILDRAVVIELRRKRSDESIERMRLDCLHASQKPLRQQWRRWADDHLEAIRNADPDVPAGLHDRAADNWRPLLAIADLAGGEWSASARSAAIELCGESEAESIGVELLADILTAYEGRSDDVIASAEIVAALVALPDRPWAEWSNGRALTTAKLARLLRPFGIAAGDYRLPAGVKRGYRRAAFADAWARYLPLKVQQVNIPNKDGLESQGFKVQHEAVVALPQSSTNPTNTARCRIVGLSEGVSGALDFSAPADETEEGCNGIF